VSVFTRAGAMGGAMTVYNFVTEARSPVYSAGPIFEKTAIGVQIGPCRQPHATPAMPGMAEFMGLLTQGVIVTASGAGKAPDRGFD